MGTSGAFFGVCLIKEFTKYRFVLLKILEETFEKDLAFHLLNRECSSPRFYLIQALIYIQNSGSTDPFFKKGGISFRGVLIINKISCNQSLIKIFN